GRAAAAAFFRLQVEEVGLRIVCRLCRKLRLLLEAQPHAQSCCDFRSYFALQRNRIGQRSFIMLRPELSLVARINKAHVDQHPITGTADAPFQDVNHAELQADLAEVSLDGGWILPHRGAWNNLEFPHLSQPRDD